MIQSLSRNFTRQQEIKFVALVTLLAHHPKFSHYAASWLKGLQKHTP